MGRVPGADGVASAGAPGGWFKVPCGPGPARTASDLSDGQTTLGPGNGQAAIGIGGAPSTPFTLPRGGAREPGSIRHFYNSEFITVLDTIL
jgi:hypothetical protein